MDSRLKRFPILKISRFMDSRFKRFPIFKIPCSSLPVPHSPFPFLDSPSVFIIFIFSQFSVSMSGFSLTMSFCVSGVSVYPGSLNKREKEEQEKQKYKRN